MDRVVQYSLRHIALPPRPKSRRNRHVPIPFCVRPSTPQNGPGYRQQGLDGPAGDKEEKWTPGLINRIDHVLQFSPPNIPSTFLDDEDDNEENDNQGYTGLVEALKSFEH